MHAIIAREKIKRIPTWHPYSKIRMPDTTYQRLVLYTEGLPGLFVSRTWRAEAVRNLVDMYSTTAVHRHLHVPRDQRSSRTYLFYCLRLNCLTPSLFRVRTRNRLDKWWTYVSPVIRIQMIIYNPKSLIHWSSCLGRSFHCSTAKARPTRLVVFRIFMPSTNATAAGFLPPFRSQGSSSVIRGTPRWQQSLVYKHAVLALAGKYPQIWQPEWHQSSPLPFWMETRVGHSSVIRGWTSYTPVYRLCGVWETKFSLAVSIHDSRSPSILNRAVRVCALVQSCCNWVFRVFEALRDSRRVI